MLRTGYSSRPEELIEGGTMNPNAFPQDQTYSVNSLFESLLTFIYFIDFLN